MIGDINWWPPILFLIAIGCGLGLLLAKIGPALWQGAMAFWRALWGGA